MSVYATVKIGDQSEWFISVAVFLTDEPVRINHNEDEWYLTAEEARRLWWALNALFADGEVEEER